MDTSSLTYKDIDQLEKTLADPTFKELEYSQEYIIRLLIQVLRNNRWLADQIASSDMRARLAFGEATEANELVNKNQKDIKFLLGIKYNYKNKTGGINV